MLSSAAASKHSDILYSEWAWSTFFFLTKSKCSSAFTDSFLRLSAKTFPFFFAPQSSFCILLTLKKSKKTFTNSAGVRPAVCSVWLILFYYGFCHEMCLHVQKLSWNDWTFKLAFVQKKYFQTNSTHEVFVSSLPACYTHTRGLFNKSHSSKYKYSEMIFWTLNSYSSSWF